MTQLYLCDPKKAVDCKKTGCVWNAEAKHKVCSSTSKREWAQTDSRGMPHKAATLHLHPIIDDREVE